MGGGGSRLHRFCFGTTAIALAALTVAGCSPRGRERTAVGIRPGRIESIAVADVIVATGGRILRDIAEAELDTHRGYLLRAEGEIDRADRTLDVIERSMPTAEVRQRIWVARRHLEYAGIQEVTGDLEPIYAAVSRVESFAPADSIRGHLDRARRELERGDRKAAGRELTRADQELLFVEVDLPVSSTRRHLAQAREALDDGTPGRAAAYLQQSEDDLVFLTGVARSPLEAAQWSLAKATALYTKGDIEGAKRYVALTRGSVGRAGDTGSEASRAALKEVLDQLQGLEGRFAVHGADAPEDLEPSAAPVRELVDSG